MLQIEAPLDGTIVRIHVRPGEAVSSNSVLAEIVDLDRLVVNVAVSGADVPRIRVDQPADLSVASDDEDQPRGELSDIHGLVSFVGLQVDPRTSTVPVRIALTKDSGLRPGQFVRARIAIAERAGRLAVPLESVVTVDGQSAIFVIEGNLATRKPVRLGIRDGAFVEVDGAGVKAGMNIVTEGSWGLPEKTRIHLIER